MVSTFVRHHCFGAVVAILLVLVLFLSLDSRPLPLRHYSGIQHQESPNKLPFISIENNTHKTKDKMADKGSTQGRAALRVIPLAINIRIVITITMSVVLALQLLHAM